MIKRIFSNELYLLIARFVLGMLFIIAGAEKIADPSAFAGSIYNYKLFPLFTINFFAIVVPWIEVTAGLFLLFGIAVKESALIINGLFAFFIVIIGISIIRGLDIDCGCFGRSGGQQVGLAKILENTFFLLMGIPLLFFDSSYLKLKE